MEDTNSLIAIVLLATILFVYAVLARRHMQIVVNALMYPFKELYIMLKELWDIFNDTYKELKDIFKHDPERKKRNEDIDYESFQYHKKMAEEGDAFSMHSLYISYKEGSGVTADYDLAAHWLLRAAYLNLVFEEVGDEYQEGILFPRDYVESLAWYLVCKKQNNLSDCDGRISRLEKKLPMESQILAQNRAKQIIDVILSGTGVPVAGSPSTPASPAPSKPASQPRGSGSGAIVSKSGHVVTAQHVIKGAGYVEVVTPSGTYPAKVLFADEANDLAVLKVDRSFDRHLNVLHSRSIRLGAKVSTIGFPNIGLQGHSPKATEGVISSDLGFQNDVRMWQVSVPIQPGNSGGPLLDEAGHVVGVVVASLSLNAVKVTGAVPQNVNYAIKSAYLEPMLGGCQVDLIQTPVAEARRLEDIMESARQASVLILTY